MPLRNRRGTAVDPVPYLVVAIAAAALWYGVGPPYLLALGVDFTEAVVAASVGATLSAWAAYHQLVWTARPDIRGERPAGIRLQTLGYATALCLVGGLLLVLPFV